MVERLKAICRESLGRADAVRRVQEKLGHDWAETVVHMACYRALKHA